MNEGEWVKKKKRIFMWFFGYKISHVGLTGFYETFSGPRQCLTCKYEGG